MRFIVSGKNVEVTDALREKAVKKFGRLEKFFNPDTDVHVTMSVEKGKHVSMEKGRQILEVTIPFHGSVLRAEVAEIDMYACIDRAMDILESQIAKNKTRLEKRLREGALMAENFSSYADVEEEKDFRIVRSKKFAIKPMAPEEAVLQMNLIGHEFFMFSNAETREVNVVYRRKNGDYGLIEPK